MTFDEMLNQVRELLQSRGRVAYRALKRRFDLDDEYLEDLKSELIKAERVAVDEDGIVCLSRSRTTGTQRGNDSADAASCSAGERSPKSL